MIKEEKRLVGAYLSRRAASYLELYANAHQISKSQIIRTAVDLWTQEKIQSNCTNDLIKLITARKQLNWNRLKQGISEAEKCSVYNSFVKSVLNDLSNRGIDYSIVKQIVGGLQI
jgi:hypothetical protein